MVKAKNQLFLTYVIDRVLYPREMVRMISKDRSEFIYTLEDDEVKCLTFIEKTNRRIRERTSAKGRSNHNATITEKTSDSLSIDLEEHLA